MGEVCYNSVTGHSLLWTCVPSLCPSQVLLDISFCSYVRQQVCRSGHTGSSHCPESVEALIKSLTWNIGLTDGEQSVNVSKLGSLLLARNKWIFLVSSLWGPDKDPEAKTHKNIKSSKALFSHRTAHCFQWFTNVTS